MPRPLDDVARDFRAAVIVGEHAQAARMAEEYTQALRAAWERMPASERAASGIPQKSCELLAWAMDVTAMHHKMAGQHLDALETAHRYLSARSNYLESAAL
jgi:hypothetical protein